MKKRAFLAMILAALFLLSGCIRIVIHESDEASDASETSKTESVETAEPGTGEPESESETEDEGKYSLKDYVGVWTGSDQNGTRIILRENKTAFYTELYSKVKETVAGREGTWSFDPETGHMTLEVTTTDDYALGGDLDKEEGTILLQCENGKTWNDEVIRRSEKWTEDEVMFQVEKALDELNGIVRLLEDGDYISGQAVEEATLNDPKHAAFKTAVIENGFVVIDGRLGVYDENWNETVLEGNSYKLELSINVELYSSGGTADDQLVDVEYFNNCFGKEATGLGLAVKMKNGVVIQMFIQS